MFDLPIAFAYATVTTAPQLTVRRAFARPSISLSGISISISLPSLKDVNNQLCVSLSGYRSAPCVSLTFVKNKTITAINK